MFQPTSDNTRRIELLAPARNYELGRVAVDYGADALYVGGPAFGARYAASNTADEIERLARYAHAYGVRVYAALNTIVFDDELAQAERVAREMAAVGVDALIIQDPAFLRMGIEGVEFHASTQMCNVSPEYVRFLGRSGFSRVILERGLTLDQIRAIRGATDVELECFVHGAICVGFSGRCYLSRSMGERSGNRGECIQACRLRFDLVDGGGNTIIKGKHLLSVRDLDLTDYVGALLDAGVCSFKIEGRLKDVSYVKNTVAHYRQTLDREIALRGDMERTSSGRTVYDFDPDTSKCFTRGRSSWTMGGMRPPVASFDTPKATGTLMGTVAQTGDDWFRLLHGGDAAGDDRFRLQAGTPLGAGDGICFMVGDELCGTNINRAEGARAYPNRMEGIVPGAAIYRNHDHAFEQRLAASRTRRVVDAAAVLSVGADEVRLSLTDADGMSVSVGLKGPFDAARDRAKMLDTLRGQIAKSGDSMFDITRVEVDCCLGTVADGDCRPGANVTGDCCSGTVADGDRRPGANVTGDCCLETGVTGDRRSGFVPFLTISQINALRRRAVETLTQARAERSLPREERTPDVRYPYTPERPVAELNIANRLAAEFWREHGLTDPQQAPDLSPSLAGRCVMTTPYCIRRETGRCLKEAPQDNAPLYLVRGRLRYRLDFDCAQCLMRLIME